MLKNINAKKTQRRKDAKTPGNASAQSTSLRSRALATLR
jgi:hypothetical protein